MKWHSLLNFAAFDSNVAPPDAKSMSGSSSSSSSSSGSSSPSPQVCEVDGYESAKSSEAEPEEEETFVHGMTQEIEEKEEKAEKEGWETPSENELGESVEEEGEVLEDMNAAFAHLQESWSHWQSYASKPVSKARAKSALRVPPNLHHILQELEAIEALERAPSAGRSSGSDEPRLVPADSAGSSSDGPWVPPAGNGPWVVPAVHMPRLFTSGGGPDSAAHGGESIFFGRAPVGRPWHLCEFWEFKMQFTEEEINRGDASRQWKLVKDAMKYPSHCKTGRFGGCGQQMVYYGKDVSSNSRQCVNPTCAFYVGELKAQQLKDRRNQQHAPWMALSTRPSQTTASPTLH